MPTPGWPSDGMFWLWKGSWLGLMNWRVGGLYAPGNAEFTTAPFAVPEQGYLWLDMDSRWGASATSCLSAYGEQCQGYITVELLPPTGSTPIPGYEKEHCQLARFHGSEQGMPLTWAGTDRKPPPPVAGQVVRARIYLRDSTVYAIGAGNTW